MAEYIERDAAIRALTLHDCDSAGAKTSILGIPAADVAPVVPGRWIDNSWGDFIKVCSNCGKEPLERPATRSPQYSRFCPNCGAKMDLEG